MADKKISALPSATTPLAGTEVLPIVQSGVTDKVSVANLTAGRDTSALVYRAGLAPNDQSGVTAPSGGLFLKNNGTVGANTVVARLSDGTYPNSALPTVELTGFGGGNVYSAAIWGTQYGGIVFATANTFGGTYTANLTLANGASGDATVNKGNLVVGTAGKGITTGGATALGLGVNNAVDAVTIDTSKNVGVGTTTPTSGSMSNSAIVNAGVFSTLRGSVASTSGVTVTLATANQNHALATYIVSCGISSGAPTVYSAVAIVSADNNVLRITNLQTASLMTLSVSGTDIRATQSSGGPANILFAITRIA